MLNNRTFFLILFFAGVVYALNLRLDVMQVDAAQYAEICWEMLMKKNFLQPTCLGNAYLDKPPLLFWMSVASFYFLGVHNYSYKLPSLLFALLAVYSSYRFAKIYYEEKVARIAAAMLATTQAMFLMTNDVRTDTILMGAVIFSIWQLTEFFESSRTKNLFLGSVGVALSLLAKGPIGLITVCAAIIPHLIWKIKWRKIFDARILISVFVIGLFLLPMCIGLYQQHGMNGFRFYFWTQSFGRITGESEWNNHPDTFFLVHSTAWQILPWSLFFFIGWITSLVNFVRNKFVFQDEKEIISLSGFTLVLIALSLSNYQLPHYVFVAFPLACVIAAKYAVEFTGVSKIGKIISGIQAIILIGLFAVGGFLLYAFRDLEIFPVSILLLFFVFCVLLFFKTRDWLITSSGVIISFNLILSIFYFPAILKYQPQNDFGRDAKEHSENNHFVCYRISADFALAFYAQQQSITTVYEAGLLKNILNEGKNLIVYTVQDGIDELTREKIPSEIIEARKSFPITHLNWKFLNPATREGVCKSVFLLRLKPS